MDYDEDVDAPCRSCSGWRRSYDRLAKKHADVLATARLQFYQIRDETEPHKLAHALAKTGINQIEAAETNVR